MIAIIDYRAGNTQSLSDALTRLGVPNVITDDYAVINEADRVILPGVGQASAALSNLRQTGLHTKIAELGQPVLGICLGMQLMAGYNEEGDLHGLQIFDAEVRKFPSTGVVPHMGWNSTSWKNDPLFQQIDPMETFYFAHSFYVTHSADTIATTEYLLPFSSALRKQNFVGVQFHPEKSGRVGEQLLTNFINQ